MQMSSQKDATVRARVPMALAPTRSLDDLSTALFSRGLLLSACATTHSSSSHSHAKRRTISQGRRVCLFLWSGVLKDSSNVFWAPSLAAPTQNHARANSHAILALLTVQALRSYTKRDASTWLHQSVRVEALLMLTWLPYLALSQKTCLTPPR